mmetsp:Transcript_32140/g.96302  ORF Transcript_32140/g.96302 Transcript_32140/m.96302 type:complete len:95 (+) Transcript_32140:928-1212(+)
MKKDTSHEFFSCDYPAHAEYSPRRIIYHHRIHAASMMSEEVALVKEFLKAQHQLLQGGGCQPFAKKIGFVDTEAFERYLARCGTHSKTRSPNAT